MQQPFSRLLASALRGLPVVAAALGGSFVAATTAREPPPFPSHLGHDARRSAPIDPRGAPDSPLLGTLVDTHSPARLPLDDVSPTPARFAALLADPVLGSTHAIDPALLSLLRSLAARHPLARVAIVSGFRSPKLNEMLRKKGHHVASHSEHSLGHAVDFRIIPDGADVPIEPAALASEIRQLGWHGGVGIYEGANDRFVHADVGRERSWHGQ